MDRIPIRHILTAYQQDYSQHFSIRDVQSLLDGKDMQQELHRHNFFYVLVIRNGEGHHEIDFVSYPVGNHTVFFIRPGQVHQLFLKAGATGYLMQFSEGFYATHDQHSRQLLRKVSGINYHPLDEDKFDNISGVLKYIFREYVRRQKKYEEVIHANMDIFFIELIRATCNDSLETEQFHIQEKLDTLLDLITLHIAEYKQVAQYAALMHLSPYQLNAVTKQTLDKTCSEVINDYIILEAKRYLLATDEQINNIAWRLGYEDVSYFIRLFKKQTGHTPDMFRKNLR
ncbi:helix-turn-helix domain-containing protein [Chitinophaga agri]|uniref:Helix-turn-helix transcriptional regulator n=1 Tax=Chitinophaga agri TaxID=2703787 RepID=A0A6B9ZD31_9BACT|nr:AraC family transcriptional regulator [Chitinophaga agri]QHS59659.1 helix-turn-helix transcriptional regulator [Chitinophaga agri]